MKKTNKSKRVSSADSKRINTFNTLHPNIQRFTKHLPLKAFDNVNVSDAWMEYRCDGEYTVNLRTLSESDLNSAMLGCMNTEYRPTSLFYLNMKTGDIFKPFVNGVGLKHLPYAGKHQDSSDDRPKPAIGQSSDCRPW